MVKLVSKQLIDFVKGFEGFEPTVRNDMVGIPTLGYGMTGSEIIGIESVTEEEASAMLESLINEKYAQIIKNNLDSRGIELTQNEFDALVSMAYNIGTTGLLTSTLYRIVCNGNRDVETIYKWFTVWDKATINGVSQSVEGLHRRRVEEARMFFRHGNIIETEEDIMEKIVLYTGDIEVLSAVMVSQKLQCPMMKKEHFEIKGLKAKEIIQIGGKEGSNRFTTFVDAAEMVK